MIHLFFSLVCVDHLSSSTHWPRTVWSTLVGCLIHGPAMFRGGADVLLDLSDSRTHSLLVVSFSWSRKDVTAIVNAFRLESLSIYRVSGRDLLVYTPEYDFGIDTTPEWGMLLEINRRKKRSKNQPAPEKYTRIKMCNDRVRCPRSGVRYTKGRIYEWPSILLRCDLVFVVCWWWLRTWLCDGRSKALPWLTVTDDGTSQAQVLQTTIGWSWFRFG